MKIFVTGGLGFIGSNYILARIAEGNTIVNYDSVTYAADRNNLKEIEKSHSYRLVEADIRNYKDVVKAMSGCDVVVHFAAESHVDNSIKGSSIFIDTNVMGTQVLLEAAKNLGIKRFLHVSTDEVYGDKLTGESNESDVLLPNNPYSASKVGAEAIVRAYRVTHGLDTVITRCTNNYGPRQHTEKFIPLVIKNAIQNKPIPVYGSGLQKREWIYVTDHCDGIHAALMNGENGAIYNFGSGVRLCNLEIVSAILHALNKPLSLIRHVDDRLGHDLRYAIDSGYARLALNFTNKITFNNGLLETINWYEQKFRKEN